MLLAKIVVDTEIIYDFKDPHIIIITRNSSKKHTLMNLFHHLIDAIT